VLRAFEQEIGVEVIRPDIAGMMGAFGAALYAKQTHKGQSASGILSYEDMKAFTYNIKSVTCNGCNNRCQLTVNDFGGGRRFIGGNRCEKPVTNKAQDDTLNLYEYKLAKLAALPEGEGTRGTIGLPMALNMYEMYPFWNTLFRELGFTVKMSGFSNRKLYLKGQSTIPSDTVCFPAKMVHGHIQQLIEMGVDAIFYPCMTYNFNEGKAKNCFNCAVIAGYPEVIEANTLNFGKVKYINEYVGPHERAKFPARFAKILQKHFAGIDASEVKKAVKKAYDAYDAYMADVRAQGAKIVAEAREAGKKIIVLAGRPYHADPEINHGIHKLICGLGFAVVSEDAVAALAPDFKVNLLSQWTYHQRLFSAAKYVTAQDDMYIVHLVSFGCGLDALTTDEVRAILEHAGQLYTQIKIDEVTNLGAIKIRLRSLIAAIDQQKGGEA
ncbi:MAG: 2-hydroxyacyl-CoA dehydratase, partial [Clostridia bacterium]|nr:2-hydroxyacyl-CoA dehydratase [Clostridia bacterium]